MTLPAATLFPQSLLPLYVFEPRHRRMLVDVLESHRMLVVAMQKPSCQRETPHEVAGLGLVRMAVQHSDGTAHVVLQGLIRVSLTPALRYKPYRVHRVTPLCSIPAPPNHCQPLLQELRDLVQRRIELGLPFPPPPTLMDAENVVSLAPCPDAMAAILRDTLDLKDPDVVADLISAILVGPATVRQQLLECVRTSDRLALLVAHLKTELARHGDPSPGSP